MKNVRFAWSRTAAGAWYDGKGLPAEVTGQLDHYRLAGLAFTPDREMTAAFLYPSEDLVLGRFMPVFPPEEEPPFAVYEPLEKYTGLFRTFARRTGEADFAAFAEKYGPLGLAFRIEPLRQAPGKGEPLWDEVYAGRWGLTFDDALEWKHLWETRWDEAEEQEAIYFDADGYPLVDDEWAWGECLADWYRARDEMRNAIDVWEALRDGLSLAGRGRAWLAKSFDASGQPNGVYLKTPWTDVAPSLFTSERKIPPSEYDRCLSEVVDAHVRRLCDVGFGQPVAGKARAHFAPRNLLGGMWLQMAAAIDGRRSYRTCSECGDDFEVRRRSSLPDGTTRRKRNDQLYCSNACKQAAYRRRETPA